MWPTRIFVHRPTLVFVTLALLAVAGAVSLSTIVQQQFPNIDFPTITVRASYPGGSTTQMRDAIVRPIEDAIAGAPNLDHLNTTVQQGQATISAVFSLTSNKTTDLVAVQQRLLLAQAKLPTDLPVPTVGTFDPAEATVVTLGVSSSSLAPGALSAIVTNDIVPELEQVDGISNVNVGGALTPAIEVQVDPHKLSSAGFTLNDVVSSISQNNNRAPGGIAYLANRETSIDVRGDVSSAATVADLPILAASQFTTSFGNTSFTLPAIPGAPGAPASSSAAGSAGGGSVAIPTPAVQAQALAPSAVGIVAPLPAPSVSAAPTPSPFVSVTPAPTVVATPSPLPASPSQTITVPATAQPPASPLPAGGGVAIPAGSRSFGGPSLSSLNQWSASARQLRIGDVASVSDAFEPQRQYSYVGGAATISLGVQKSTNASEVTAAQNVMKALPAIQRSYPAVDFRVLNNQAEYTKQQIWSVFHTLIEAVLITAVVMLFFLRSWRNAIVVLIAIPASLCVTLTVMRLVNFTIDTVSLLAMTLIIGILVDDSIVVLENIERHHAGGERAQDAAIKGRTQIGAAAVVITLVDVVVFLPIAFLPGTVGKFLSEFALVVVVATLTSLAISFTITPSLAGNWSLLSQWKPPRPIEAFARGFERLRQWYAQRALPWALARARLVFVVCAVAVVLSVMLVPLGVVGFEFIPPVDRGEVFVQLTYPTGTPLATVNAAIQQIDQRIYALPDTESLTALAGGTQANFGGLIAQGSVGQIHVFLKEKRRRPTDFWVRVFGRIAGALAPTAKVVAIPATGTGGGNAQPIDYLVTSTNDDPDAYAEQVAAALRQTPGTLNVNTSAEQLAPQIDIEFARELTRTLSVNIGQAASAIRAAFGGTLATQFNTSRGTKYVQVIYPRAFQTTLRTVSEIPLRSNGGGLTYIGDVAKFVNDPSSPLMTRVNRQTVVHVQSNLEPGATQSIVQNAFARRLAALHLPATVSVRANVTGQQQNLSDTVRGMGAGLILSLCLVYLLMVALYNSYRLPFIIMFSVPVAAVGALTSLALTHQALNLFSLIGTVLLVGLASKNGILLVDFANHMVAGGMDRASALVEAARERFRPIIMTTCAMIAGMTPIALALDPGAGQRQALGIVVIGGLISSLVLTLVLVPVMFMWLGPSPKAREDAVTRDLRVLALSGSVTGH
ncbi:MAG TPA: efflux RND transporter permease subunit [Candidatus Acidoferrales bacterium]|nr:efflux RND transporter permease subunit [Candidatus Acidoferrales bacterium]